MSTIISVPVVLEKIVCSNCSGVYALTSDYINGKRKLGGLWKCPYCRIDYGFNVSENDKLRRDLQKERQKRDQAEAAQREAEKRALRAERNLKTTKSQAKRDAQRTVNGVCPCCTRSFVNLRRHIATKHPDYVEETKTP